MRHRSSALRPKHHVFNTQSIIIVAKWDYDIRRDAQCGFSGLDRNRRAILAGVLIALADDEPPFLFLAETSMLENQCHPEY